MDGAIDFDDEFERRAVEVDDESSDDVLTSKLEARELAFSYSAPELGLGWRGVASHLPGMFEFRSGSVVDVSCSFIGQWFGSVS